jgi:signal transduction histidine kinase
MTAPIGILCCHNFHREVSAAVAAEGWTDITVHAFPARCGRPPLAWDELRGILPADCGHVLVIGRACLGGLGEVPSGFPPLRLLKQQQCFHIVASPALVDQAIADGAYLMTPAWLADWRGRLAEMGFQPETAGEFFKDFASSLLLLDTGIDPDSVKRMDELTRALGVPATRIGVGLDHTRLLLARALLEVRLDDERRQRTADERRHRRELADHASGMDLLAQLARTQSEADAVAAIENVFRMLFAPASWHYLRVDAGQPLPDAELPGELLAAMRGLAGTWAWTPSGNGFLLRIAREEQTLGLLAVDGLAFPEFRERYLNLALAMSGVCALAIDNARTRKRLVEAEKMASLGVLVAGVAHEINTPLGVGLAAISTLQQQSGEIADRFAARQMTQSNLQAYLAAATTETALIRANLDRIGKLVDAFRQVAVLGGTPTRRRLSLRTLIGEVVASFETRLVTAGANVDIRCAPALEIDGVHADWTTILSNLIANSLHHGFAGRDHGLIAISADADSRLLTLDYRDDGAGMSAEVRQRIFDPFFSTDLQHGMGLGMHLVYNLVTQRMGGRIVCGGAPGEGAHFHIEVPL